MALSEGYRLVGCEFVRQVINQNISKSWVHCHFCSVLRELKTANIYPIGLRLEKANLGNMQRS